MVSYDGHAVKIMELLHQSAHGWAKAVVRRVDHDSAVTDTVISSDLMPIGTSRPELIAIQPLELEPGLLAFFMDDKQKVSAGTILECNGGEFDVHLHQQAKKQDRRFTPLYRLKTGAVEAKEKRPGSAEKMIVRIHWDSIIATTPIAKFRITDQGLPALKSRGVVVNPVVQLSQYDSVKYIQLLRGLANVLRLNPICERRVLLDRVATALHAWDDRFQLYDWTPTLDELEHLYHVHLVHEPTKRTTPYRVCARSHSHDAPSARQANSDSLGNSAESTMQHPMSPVQLSAVVVGTVLTYTTWAFMEMLHKLIRDSHF